MHFFSSDESEEEEEQRRKFKIKIKPLPPDCVITAPTVDELKASIGNIALSPSPLGLNRNSSNDDIVRPRRVVTVPPVAASSARQPQICQSPVTEDTLALFGPPLETAFGEQKTEAVLSDAWGVSLSESNSSLSRAFPTGTPPPLPPKNVQTPPPTAGSVENPDSSTEAESPHRKPSIADLDNVFGPEAAPPAAEETNDSWVCFSEDSPAPKEQAPVLPSSPPLPPSSPPPSLPTSPSPPQELAPSPPPPTTPPRPKEDTAPPIPTSPLEQPQIPSGPTTPQDREPLSTSPPPPPKDLASPPAMSPPIISSTSPPPQVSTPPTDVPTMHSPPPLLPPTVTSPEEKPISPKVPLSKEDSVEVIGSSKDTGQESRGMAPSPQPPQPPQPPAYSTVASPGPTSGTNSGSSSPVRPSTPSSVNPTPPPPPPRPPSRPKLPPGKPTVDGSRPFSPPVHSASPPPVAPLARAESTSSISSTNSAATTPTVNKELCVSVSGCSRGPSPLTMGAQDTLPVAAAFTETVNAFFKGADPSKCVVKVIGEMVVSFPAGITRHFANNPSPAVLTFSITNYNRLEQVLPNPQLLCCDHTTATNGDSKNFWVNMPNLITHLKKVSEQKPQATYYNVDMLKYQVSVQGLHSTPLNLAVSWRCDASSTDLRIDYKYNGDAMATPTALNNVQFLVPVDGGVSKLQAVLPPAAWNAEQQRILWKIPDISLKSENGGVGSLLARFQLTQGPSKPAPLAVQFTSEGSTLSGCDIELAGPGYRFSLIKKRFAAGKYLADN
ncbi:SH3-containing GRB2-like protein 3-interacting protein 1 isoform X1 [Periophthalmus magnuspinnatus]|uniref:SH3-containing GRB2-like protein 3-interacting protein 1 isoform X1 n=1 Tax=Periophthalmus magnuspinnatus TaxID=409849 RepID=UPI00243674A9|nr:SH3-containing GRB2-like protein 3-interacting protein 1 isoform X1 [Periophthalmus magnuspinnatus]